MILSDGTVIDRETARHKFGGDPMAEYLHRLSLYGAADEQTGDVQWSYYAQRFGRRILTEDSQGFVELDTLEDEQAAIEAFERIQAEYDYYLGEED